MNLLFGFHGRINRAKYWAAVGIWIVYMIVFSFISWAILGTTTGSVEGESVDLTGLGERWLVLVVLGLLWLAPVFVSSIAVGIKRLHDRNKSGWWLVLFYLVPWIISTVTEGMAGMATVIAAATSDMTLLYLALVLSFGALGLSIWAFVELGCLRGTRGPNRYGPDPLPDPTVAEVFR